jgi:hypothetical protein
MLRFARKMIFSGIFTHPLCRTRLIGRRDDLRRAFGMNNDLCLRMQPLLPENILLFSLHLWVLAQAAGLEFKSEHWGAALENGKFLYRFLTPHR